MTAKLRSSVVRKPTCWMGKSDSRIFIYSHAYLCMEPIYEYTQRVLKFKMKRKTTYQIKSSLPKVKSKLKATNTDELPLTTCAHEKRSALGWVECVCV